MKYSIRHCAFVISALLIGVSAIEFNTPAQARPTRQRHDYLGAWNIAYSAINQCYTQQKNLDECDKLNHIKNTLIGWCSEKDRDACILYKKVSDFENVVQQAESIGDMPVIR
jgi:hypothetical protein